MEKVEWSLRLYLPSEHRFNQFALANQIFTKVLETVQGAVKW